MKTNSCLKNKNKNSSFSGHTVSLSIYSSAYQFHLRMQNNMQVIKANKYKKNFLSTLPNLPPTICQILQKQKRVPIILPNNITVLSDICMMKTISRLNPLQSIQKSKIKVPARN